MFVRQDGTTTLDNIKCGQEWGFVASEDTAENKFCLWSGALTCSHKLPLAVYLPLAGKGTEGGEESINAVSPDPARHQLLMRKHRSLLSPLSTDRNGRREAAAAAEALPRMTDEANYGDG